jgi:hypothetical protein
MIEGHARAVRASLAKAIEGVSDAPESNHSYTTESVTSKAQWRAEGMSKVLVC